MRLCTATLVFVYAACCAALVCGFVVQGLGCGSALLSLAVGLSVGILAWRTLPASGSPRRGLWDWVMLAVFGLASFRAFGWLIFTTGDDIRVLTPNNLGDIALHLNIIRSLAHGVPFWPESTILVGMPLTYPVGADLFNALLEMLHVPTFSGLIMVGFVGAAMTAYALWRWGGAFGLTALLFNGGLAGFVVLSNLRVADYQAELIWKNLFLTMFVTQRGLLIALPAGLLLLASCRERFFRGNAILPRWVEVLVYAGLPLFNVHAFIFVSLIYATVFLFRKEARISLLQLVGVSFVPATLLVCLVTGFFAVSSGAEWTPDWITKERGPFTWISDFGLLFPLVGILCGLLVREKDVEARCFVFPAVIIFAICCFVALAPWPWDNMKLILWSWLVIAPYLWTKIVGRIHWAGSAALCFALFFSGAVSLVGGLTGRSGGYSEAEFGYVLAKRSDLAVWEVATKGIPYTDRFVIAPDFNHPLILLGRRVACGYDGHLWSHGLPYGEKYRVLKSALIGETPWDEAAPILGSQWLALRRDERPASGLYSSGDAGSIYDLRPLLKPGQNTQSPPLLLPRAVDSTSSR